MHSFSLLLLLFASFFWAWALKNTVEMDAPNADLGVLSFLTVMLTSTYMLGVESSPRSSVSGLTAGLATASHVFVALNYALGCYLGFAVLDRPGFGAYCGIFTVLWFGIAITSQRLLSAGRSSGEENVALVSGRTT